MGKIYYTKAGGSEAIFRANLDGTNVEAIIGGSGPSDIAVDGVGGKIYWVNPQASEAIFRANLDGTNVEAIIGGDASHVAVLSGSP